MAKNPTPKSQQISSEEPTTPVPAQAEKPKRYRVIVPNQQFSEKVAGVLFQNGKAVIDIETIDAGLGRSPDEIARIMREDFGYSVQELD